MEIENLNNTINQLDLTDIHKSSSQQQQNAYFLPVADRTFSTTEHMLGHKSSVNKFRKTETIQRICSEHKEMKLKINNIRRIGKFQICGNKTIH